MHLSCMSRMRDVARVNAFRRFWMSSTAELHPSKVHIQASSERINTIRGRELEFRRFINKHDDIRNDLAYCLSFVGDETDFEKNRLQLEQCEFSKDQLRKYEKRSRLNDEPLPRTLDDALRPSRRAIVVTEAVKPFRVVDVNRAWEDLCGYRFLESKGKTLGSLLRGPETDQTAATALIAHLLRGEEAGTTLTNYTKTGRRFRNRIVVGPLQDSDGNITHFVGVLQEIRDGL